VDLRGGFCVYQYLRNGLATSLCGPDLEEYELGNEMRKKMIRLLAYIIVLSSLAYVSSAAINHFEYGDKFYTNIKASSIAIQENYQTQQAIPVLLYHGLIKEPNATNVAVEQFSRQMRALKEAGYYTISSEELLDFYGGKEFYGKPILITFDDGRKDSYYGADKVLEKLGFKATMYVATGKQLAGDPFFLSWKELADMKGSGRWELEPHGREAHNRIQIDQDGNYGHYLTNKMWLDDRARLETDGEAALRVMDDYRNAAEDLKSHFPDLQVRTYAIPLNDYGVEPNNFPRASGINEEALEQFYKMGMVQDNDGYNYRDTNPYRTKRFAVGGDWDVEGLFNALNGYGQEPQLVIGNNPGATSLSSSATGSEEGIVLQAGADNEQAQMVYGSSRWSNYSVEVLIESLDADSFYIDFLRNDSEDYASFGFDNSNFYLRESVHDVDSELAVKSFDNSMRQAPISLSITIDASNRVNAYCRGMKIFENFTIPYLDNHGALGMEVWSREPGKASARISYLQVSPLREVLAYFSYSNEAEAFSSLETNAVKINYLTPSWYRFNGDGSMAGKGYDERLAAFTKKNKIGLLPLLANYDPGTQEASADLASAIINNEQVSRRAISETVRTAVEKGLAGYNLDFEGLHPEDRDALSGFVEELALELHRSNKLLYVSLSAKTGEGEGQSWTAALDYGRIGKAADRVILMVYNESWSGSYPGAFQSDLYIQKVAKFAAGEIDRGKLIIGYALYGMDWTLDQPGSCNTLSFSDVMNIEAASSAKHQYDETTKTQKLTYNDGDHDHEVWYEDYQSLGEKLRTPDSFGLPGIAIWSLGREDQRIWSLLGLRAPENR
jgi:spore germination protein YaaH/peptidoglycan/xylan/chitin deacetylase (PgdA/CDA1 family)